jgi:hypothetical protein
LVGFVIQLGTSFIIFTQTQLFHSFHLLRQVVQSATHFLQFGFSLVLQLFSNFFKNKLPGKMYSTLLSLHSLFRWLVVASLLIAISKSIIGLFTKNEFTPLDNSIRHWTATIAHIQFAIGVTLYFVSPIIDYFLHNYSEAVHVREIRFFGMEHSVMMLTAITLITVGSIKAKRKKTDSDKFKSMTIWFLLAFLIILLMIPWSFSPLANRPYFRPL